MSTNPANPANNKTVKEFRDGSMSVAVKRYHFVREDGEEADFHSGLVTRTYTDRDGAIRTSASFTLSQIPVLIRLLEAARDFMWLQDGDPNDDLREFLGAGPGKKQSRPSKRTSNGAPVQVDVDDQVDGRANGNTQALPISSVS